MAHPDFADQLTLFQPGGTDYAHIITTGTPRFSDLPMALKILTCSLLETSVEEARLSNEYERQNDVRKNNNLPVIIQKISKCTVYTIFVSNLQWII